MDVGEPSRCTDLRWAAFAALLVDIFVRPDAGKQPGSYREEFRAPAGVRKSPKNEPAGRRRCVMGISISRRCRG